MLQTPRQPDTAPALDGSDERELRAAIGAVWDATLGLTRRCHLANLAARGLVTPHGDGDERYWTLSRAGWRTMVALRRA